MNNSVEYQVANESEKNRYRNVEYLLSDETVYVIQKAGGYYYVGTDVGIYVLNSKFEKSELQKTDNPVQDIKMAIVRTEVQKTQYLRLRSMPNKAIHLL